MLTIFHGENNSGSRAALSELKAKYDEVIELDGKTVSETDFIQASQSGSLLGTKRLVVIENYFAGKKEHGFPLSDATVDIALWEDKELTKSQAEKLKNARMLLYKPEASVFKFVESIRPGGKKQAYNLFKTALRSSSAEFLFAMIVRQFRLILNPGSLPPWQQAKINSQAKFFDSGRAVEVYRKLLNIDFAAKTGRLNGSLEDNLIGLILWI